MYHSIRCKKHLTQADVAELVDALDLGSSISDVRVRVSPSALINLDKSQCIALALVAYKGIMAVTKIAESKYSVQLGLRNML